MSFQCRHLSKRYRASAGPVKALEDVSFSVGEGEFVCIVGPSGCGKTTLLKIIAGLVPPTSGRLEFAPAPADEKIRVSLVFQNHGLFPWMTVLENVAFCLETKGVGRHDRQQKAREFVTRVGLGDFEDHYPGALSSGMQQRVGIARAFLADPHLLLMDEPFGSLDAQTRRILQDELLRQWRESRKTVLFVTHDVEEAVLLADRVLVLSARPGTLLEEIAVPLPRPRRLSFEGSRETGHLEERIWKLLEAEVRRSLRLPA